MPRHTSDGASRDDGRGAYTSDKSAGDFACNFVSTTDSSERWGAALKLLMEAASALTCEE